MSYCTKWKTPRWRSFQVGFRLFHEMQSMLLLWYTWFHFFSSSSWVGTVINNRKVCFSPLLYVSNKGNTWITSIFVCVCSSCEEHNGVPSTHRAPRRPSQGLPIGFLTPWFSCKNVITLNLHSCSFAGSSMKTPKHRITWSFDTWHLCLRVVNLFVSVPKEHVPACHFFFLLTWILSEMLLLCW